jgi:hypothetical protein
LSGVEIDDWVSVVVPVVVVSVLVVVVAVLLAVPLSDDVQLMAKSVISIAPTKNNVAFFMSKYFIL